MSSALTEALCEDFNPDLFLTDPDLTASYARDRTGSYFGLPLAVARPRTTEDVAAIMVRCAELNLRAVPQGGLTGLVGAAVSDANEPEIVVLLDRMNMVRSVDPVGYAMVVEAGCVLEVAKQAADAEECLLPITFGSQGSARIGGNVSTNAGGFNVLRYGMTRDLVLGLEVVLPDGRIWNGLRTLRKDNRGYDLKQLFIGAEGTLGIVTAAALKLFPKPTQVETALLGLRSVDDVMAFYAKARRSCSDLLSAFELILRDGLVLGLAHRTDLTDPLDQPCPVYVLMEVSAGGAVDLRQVLEACLEEAAESDRRRDDRSEQGAGRAPMALPGGDGRSSEPGRSLLSDRCVRAYRLDPSLSRCCAGRACPLAPRGPANHLWPCRRRQHPPQCRAPSALVEGGALCVVRTGRDGDLRDGRPVRWQHQRRTWHWAVKEASLSRTGRPRDARPLPRKIKGALDADNRLSPGRIFDF